MGAAIESLWLKIRRDADEVAVGEIPITGEVSRLSPMTHKLLLTFKAAYQTPTEALHRGRELNADAEFHVATGKPIVDIIRRPYITMQRGTIRTLNGHVAP